MTLALILAVALALVFVAAAVSKAIALDETISGFDQLGIPTPKVAVGLVIVVEVALAVALVLIPAWGSLAAIAVLVGFTVFLAGLVRSGRPVACRCFGGATTEPVSVRTLARNGVLLVVAVAVAVLS